MIMNQKMIDHQSNDLNDLIRSEFSIDDDDHDDTNNHKNKIERFPAIQTKNGMIGCSKSHLAVLDLAINNNFIVTHSELKYFVQ